MFKLKIINKKSKQQTHGGEFSTVQEQEAWKQSCEAVSAWGTPEHEEQVLVSEAIPEVLDEEGNVIQEAVEAVYETKVIPAEYTIEIENITQQVAAEKSKQEQKKLAKEKRKAIDVDKIKTVADCKAAIKLIMETLGESEG